MLVLSVVEWIVSTARCPVENLLASGFRRIVLRISYFSYRYTLRVSRNCPLHLSRTLYKSTLFMQNKPNFPDDQMNVTKVMKKHYEKKDTWSSGKNKPNSKPNKPNTNPIKPNFRKPKMNINKVLTKDYENKANWALFENKPNTNPIKPNTNPISPLHAAKYTQYKPNQSKFQTGRLLIDPMKPLYPVRKPAFREGMIFSTNLRNREGFNTPSELFNGLYTPADVQYYSRRKCRCSSTVEHSFRKAGVEGPNPSIGFVNLQEKYNSLQQVLKEIHYDI